MAAKVRIGASMARSAYDVVDWLDANVGHFQDRKDHPKGLDYIGTCWTARWRQYGSGWFMDVEIDDPKLMTLFVLRWR